MCPLKFSEAQLWWILQVGSLCSFLTWTLMFIYCAVSDLLSSAGCSSTSCFAIMRCFNASGTELASNEWRFADYLDQV